MIVHGMGSILIVSLIVAQANAAGSPPGMDVPLPGRFGGEPEAEQVAAALRLGVVLVGRAAVQDDVVVEELHVAFPQVHGERGKPARVISSGPSPAASAARTAPSTSCRCPSSSGIRQ